MEKVKEKKWTTADNDDNRLKNKTQVNLNQTNYWTDIQLRI